MHRSHINETKGKEGMTRKLAVLTAVLAIFAANAAQAGLSKGSKEVSLFGTYADQSYESDYGGDSGQSTLTLGGTINYFTTEEISLGAQVQANITKPDEGDNSETIFFVGRGDYHFFSGPEATGVPYAGIQVGMATYESGGESESDFVYGLQGGYKWFLNENTSLNTELAYTIFEVEDAEINTLSFIVGISYYFE